MKFTKLTACKLLAVAAAAALLVGTLTNEYNLPGERAAGAQTVVTNLSENPPEISSMTASPLSAPTAEGNARLVVKFAAGSGLGAQVTARIDDRDVLLRDDGLGGDASAGDGKYSGVIRLDFHALANNQSRVDHLNNPYGMSIDSIDGAASSLAVSSDSESESATA